MPGGLIAREYPQRRSAQLRPAGLHVQKRKKPTAPRCRKRAVPKCQKPLGKRLVQTKILEGQYVVGIDDSWGFIHLPREVRDLVYAFVFLPYSSQASIIPTTTQGIKSQNCSTSNRTFDPALYRNIIRDLGSSEDKDCSLTFRKDKHIAFPVRKRSTFFPLFETNRQVYHEACHWVFRNVTFRFDELNSHDAATFLNSGFLGRVQKCHVFPLGKPTSFDLLWGLGRNLKRLTIYVDLCVEQSQGKYLNWGNDKWKLAASYGALEMVHAHLHRLAGLESFSVVWIGHEIDWMKEKSYWPRRFADIGWLAGEETEIELKTRPFCSKNCDLNPFLGRESLLWRVRLNFQRTLGTEVMRRYWTHCIPEFPGMFPRFDFTGSGVFGFVLFCERQRRQRLDLQSLVDIAYEDWFLRLERSKQKKRFRSLAR